MYDLCSINFVESLIGILEAIGAHSITSSELKRMIGLFTPLDNGSQVTGHALVVQRLDNAIHHINHSPVDNC